MYLVICIRQHQGKDIAIPIMQTDSNDEPTEVMATWDNEADVLKFCSGNMLCKSSRTLIIDTEQ